MDKYEILESNSLKELRKKVNDACSDWTYIPTGGVTSYIVPGTRQTFFMQAIYQPDPGVL